MISAGMKTVMFAIKNDSKIYHLTEAVNNTVCRLRVFKILADPILHGVQDEPTAHTLCKHCERIQNGRKIDRRSAATNMSQALVMTSQPLEEGCTGYGGD